MNFIFSDFIESEVTVIFSITSVVRKTLGDKILMSHQLSVWHIKFILLYFIYLLVGDQGDHTQLWLDLMWFEWVIKWRQNQNLKSSDFLFFVISPGKSGLWMESWVCLGGGWVWVWSWKLEWSSGFWSGVSLSIDGTISSGLSIFKGVTSHRSSKLNFH